jgi:hypothetical protein
LTFFQGLQHSAQVALQPEMRMLNNSVHGLLQGCAIKKTGFSLHFGGNTGDGNK